MWNWQPDDASSVCLICRTKFSFFTRRHHCRHCGVLCCHDCSKERLPLSETLVPSSPGGVITSPNPNVDLNTPERCCSQCVTEYRQRKQMEAAAAAAAAAATAAATAGQPEASTPIISADSVENIQIEEVSIQAPKTVSPLPDSPSQSESRSQWASVALMALGVLPITSPGAVATAPLSVNSNPSSELSASSSTHTTTDTGSSSSELVYQSEVNQSEVNQSEFNKNQSQDHQNDATESEVPPTSLSTQFLSAADDVKLASEVQIDVDSSSSFSSSFSSSVDSSKIFMLESPFCTSSSSSTSPSFDHDDSKLLKGEPDDMSRVESPFAAPAERDQTVLSESVVNSCVESEYNQTPDLQEANPPPPPPSAEPVSPADRHDDSDGDETHEGKTKRKAQSRLSASVCAIA